jgi:hypothetical protein
VNECHQQNADGTWSEAKPLPYYHDRRSIPRRVWDVAWMLITFRWLRDDDD